MSEHSLKIESLLKIENLSVGFGRGDAIEKVTEQVSFTINKGETLALVERVALGNRSPPMQY